MFSPSNDPNSGTRQSDPAAGRDPLTARNVRLIPHPAARVAPRFPRAARVDTTFKVDGRPVVVYVERPRYRLTRPVLKVTAAVVPIVATIAAVAWLIASVVAWLAANILLIAGCAVALVVAAVTLLIVLSRSGVACVGIHCSGCGHQ
jgi:hypothetical protein